MFADRGIPDTLCYARLTGLTNQEPIRRACDKYRYASRVFVAPSWKEIYGTEAERKQTFEEAVQTAELMVKTYEECGYEVIEIPRSTPTERADFIEKALQSKHAF
jgi:predicted ATPase